MSERERGVAEVQTIGRLRRRRACHGVLVGDTVRSGGEVTDAVAIVQRRWWPVAVFPSLAMPPHLIGLEFRDYRWGVLRLR